MRGQRKRNASAAGFVKNFVAVSQLTIHGNFPRLRSARALVRTPYERFRFCSIPLSVHPIRLSICPSVYPSTRWFVRSLVRSFVDPVSHCRSTLRRKSFARATTKCCGLFINNRWIFQQAHTEHGDETDRVIGDTAWLASDLKERKPAGK